jgi:hypothetical protein
MAQIAEWLGQSGNGSGPAAALASGISAGLGTLNTRTGKATGGVDLNLLLPLTLFVLGVRGLLIAKTVPFPAWYDLWWFALGTFYMLNRSGAQGIQ